MAGDAPWLCHGFIHKELYVVLLFYFTVQMLRQVLNIREGCSSALLFSDSSTLLRSELDSFVVFLAANRVL